MSMGAELKDFVSAFSAGYSIIPSKSDRANKDAQTSYYQAQADKLKNGDPLADAETKARTNLINAQTAQVGKAPAAAPVNPWEQAKLQSDIDHQDAETNKLNAPDPDVAGITKFAQSQAVPTGAAPQAPAPAPQAAPAPAPQAVPTGALDYAPAASTTPAEGAANALGTGQPIEPPPYHSEHSSDAVKAGATTALKNAGVDQTKSAVPTDASGPTRNFLKGAGAAPQSMVDAVNKIVDPTGTMPESERNLRALTTVYDYYVGKGDTKKANDAAASLYQAYSVASSQYAAFAKAAASAGDIDTATKAMVKAYAQVPNGQTLQIVKDPKSGGYAVSVTDENGKVTQQGILSPDEIAAQVMKVSPADFHSLVLNAAGVKEAASPPVPSATERNASNGAVKDAFDAAIPDPKSFSDPKDAPIALSAAQHIYASDENGRNKITPTDAVAAVQSLTRVDPANPSDPADPRKAPFQVEDAKGGKNVTFGNGMQAFVPDAQFAELMAMRGRDAQAIVGKQDTVRAKAGNESDAWNKYVAARKAIQPELNFYQQQQAARASQIQNPAPAAPAVAAPAPANPSAQAVPVPLPSVIPRRASPRDPRPGP